MLSAVIEVWSFAGYTFTTPAVFEIQMQQKYSDSSTDAEIFELCRRTAVTDLGRIFSKDLFYMSEEWSHTAADRKSWAVEGPAFAKPLPDLLVLALGGLDGMN